MPLSSRSLSIIGMQIVGCTINPVGEEFRAREPNYKLQMRGTGIQEQRFDNDDGSSNIAAERSSEIKSETVTSL